MEYRKLGATGLTVSAVGFGTWGLGGDAYGAVPEETAVSALRTAHEMGITFFDTADLYGDGRSEDLIGRTFPSARRNIVIATKVGFLPRGRAQDFSNAYVRAGLDASLRRLRTDYVDLYQLHDPPLEAITDDLMRTLEDLRRAGKVRAFGISVRSPLDARPAIETFGFRCVQVNFNLADQRAIDAGLLDLAMRQGVGLIARTPLCFGYLTGKIPANLPDDVLDHRTRWSREQRRRWSDAPALLEPIYRDGGRTPLEIALQFCLSSPGISTVIPGMMDPGQVQENVAAADPRKRLSTNDLAHARAVYLDHFAAPLDTGRTASHSIAPSVAAAHLGPRGDTGIGMDIDAKSPAESPGDPPRAGEIAMGGEDS